MGVWSWLIGEPEVREETQPVVTPPVSDVLLQALLNNEVITREKALTLPAVSGAVDFICNCIATMPVKLYRIKSGAVEEQTRDVRVSLLNGDTGDTLDAYQLKKAMVEDYLLGKGGYCFIERNRNDVVSLRYVEDRYISILKNFKPIYKDYVILVEGEEHEPYEFIKLLRNTKDGASGIGVTVEVSKALETAYSTLMYQLGLVKSGGNKKGFLKAQRKLGQEEINLLKQAWSRMYANSTENVVVLNNGLEFQEASNSSVEMQLNESKKTLMQEINDLFHIYPDDFDRTFKEAIYPIVKAFETALNRDLLLEKEKGKLFFEFDVKEIIRANLKERYESYKLAKETGFLTLNEIRRAENLNDIEGLDVVNVGLGAVLYDVNTQTYYTPNTDSQTTLQEDEMLENHELAEEYDESGNSAVRYNENHGENGQFTSGDGGGGSSSSKDDKIADLEKQLSEAKSLLEKNRIKNQIEMEKAGFKGTVKEWKEQKAQEKEKAIQEAKEAKEAKEKEEQESSAKDSEAQAKELEHEMQTQPKDKVEQFKIIQETNPMHDDYHVGIRKPSDIKTWDEVIDDEDSFTWGDFTKADAEEALKTGKITIYSSKPIKQGTFISPSKAQAEEYAGGKGKKVYSKTIPLKDVAWINGDEGQFAKL